MESPTGNNAECRDTIHAAHSEPVPAKLLIFACGLSIFWVIFIWGFWEHPLRALGMNATLFLILFIHFLHVSIERPIFFERSEWRFIAPLWMVVLSFALYENPFITACNFAFLPFALGFLMIQSRKNVLLSGLCGPCTTLFAFLYPLFSPFARLAQAVSAYAHIFLKSSSLFKILETEGAKSIFRGLLSFLLLSVFIILPLLSSADSVFEAFLDSILSRSIELLVEFFSNDIPLRILCVIFFSQVFLAIALAWSHDTPEGEQREAKPYDTISAAVLLSGVMIIYAIFLYVQFERLWLGVLPLRFQETELYVKSGFWQLIALTALNIYLVFLYIHRANSIVKILLSLFVLASALLLASAAHRMFLYVTYYGLSYEKFYASYAVGFCFLLFCFLGAALRTKKNLSVVRMALVLFLWMYGLVAITPVEYLIVRANLSLSQRVDTRIDLSDLRILSADALSVVKQNHYQLRSGGNAKPWRTISSWIGQEEVFIRSKSWYEQSASSLVGSLL